ncbi:MAG: serine--tRNA ligase [Clostridia bacterium]|nr:serine--tRNA ligase [Clostridia bacterium]
MLDLRWVREHPEEVRAGMRAKGVDEAPLDELLAADRLWREALAELEGLRATRNRVSEEIGRRRRAGEAAEELVAEMRSAGERIKELEAAVREQEARIREALLAIPNLPAPDVPPGPDESANAELRRAGEPRRFDFEPLPHWELGVRLGILDFERAGKITGSRFAVYRGAGARLARALVQFMLDLHVERHGYSEVYPPFLVNGASMTGTGQLPKFAEDAFKVEGRDLWLVPTAEVPVTNLYRDEILDGARLPIKHCAYTACFRSEAGAAGRDTRGLIRQHEFDKVELVKFVAPETSEAELWSLIRDAEEVLEALGLPYRELQMCTGDLGFTAAKKIDLEVWMPSYGRYVEISSCSNFTDFQARRANIRFRRTPESRAELVHTLNGSGLAVGRTFAAILENCQQADGSVLLPEALRPYMRGLERIGPEA